MSDIVRRLVEQQGCLLAAFAEVRRENVLGWIPDTLRADWEAVTDATTERHDFDIAITYNRRLFTLMDHVWVRGHLAHHSVRAGLVATFALADDRGWLVVAVAHWRSDAGNAEDAGARRSFAASRLCEQVSVCIQDLGEEVPVLILGDFNAEPFDEPFKANLPSSRSRDVVQRHKPRSPEDLLFYNAAWRWLGEHHAWDGDRRPPTLAGTYMLPDKSVPSRWRTFDQVLVSSSLLRDAGWSLDEGTLGILAHDDVFDSSVGCPRTPFDHLPIWGHLRWLIPKATE